MQNENLKQLLQQFACWSGGGTREFPINDSLDGKIAWANDDSRIVKVRMGQACSGGGEVRTAFRCK
jgi:hypothetical protein